MHAQSSCTLPNTVSSVYAPASLLDKKLVLLTGCRPSTQDSTNKSSLNRKQPVHSPREVRFTSPVGEVESQPLSAQRPHAGLSWVTVLLVSLSPSPGCPQSISHQSHGITHNNTNVARQEHFHYKGKVVKIQRFHPSLTTAVL